MLAAEGKAETRKVCKEGGQRLNRSEGGGAGGSRDRAQRAGLGSVEAPPSGKASAAAPANRRRPSPRQTIAARSLSLLIRLLHGPTGDGRALPLAEIRGIGA